MKRENGVSMLLKGSRLLVAAGLICLFALALLFDANHTSPALARGQGNNRTRQNRTDTRRKTKPAQTNTTQANANTTNTQTPGTTAQNANTGASGNQGSTGQGRPPYQVQPPASDVQLDKHNIFDGQEMTDETNVPIGADILYRVDFSNRGTGNSRNLNIIDPLQDRTDFKLGSVEINLGTTGLTARVTYSKDGGEHCNYTPVSGGGGAPPGYDRLVTDVCWTFTGDLSFVAPNNAGSVSYLGRRR